MTPADGPTRPHPLAAMRSAARTLVWLLPLFVLALLGQSSLPSSGLSLVLSGIVAASLIEGIGGWYRFSISEHNGRLLVVRGLLVRQRIEIDPADVRSVDVAHHALERLFGLVSLVIRRSSTGSAVELPALLPSRALELKSRLSLAMATAARPRVGAGPTWRLSTGRLLVATSTSGPFWLTVCVTLVILWWVDRPLASTLLDGLGLTGTAALEATQASPWRAPLMASVVVSCSAWLLTLAVHVVRFHGLTLSGDSDALRLCRGLFEGSETKVALHRVQAIRLLESPLRMALGYGSVRIEVSGFAGERGCSLLLHPALRRCDWERFVTALMPSFHVERMFVPPPARALPVYATRGVVAVSLILAPLSWLLPHGSLLWFLLPIGLLLGHIAHRDSGVALCDELLTLKRRRLGRSTLVLRRACTQFVAIEQDPWSRRRHLASLRLGFASGDDRQVFVLPALDEHLCSGLLDWLRGDGVIPEAPGSWRPSKRPSLPPGLLS